MDFCLESDYKQCVQERAKYNFYMEKSSVTNKLEEQIESQTHRILEKKGGQ